MTDAFAPIFHDCLRHSYTPTTPFGKLSASLYRVMVLSDSLGQRQELNELPARRAEPIIHLSLNLKAMARRNSEEILNKTNEK